ncbi:MAG: chloride channel protein, partial [Planctomycetes bacterium]|nr:chloride channel protein [Planctomycetota bacterium]
MKRTPLLVRWSIIAVVVGPLCGYAVVLFKRMATASAEMLYQHTGTFYLALPLGGALVVALLYLFVPGAAGEGMPSYVESVRSGDKRLPFKVTIAKFFSAGIVLASGGSGGMVGPVSRVCAGLGQDVGRILPKIGFETTLVRHAAICGAAAG